MVWVLFGSVTAVVASNKGRSGLGWLLLGVLLGPIGFILSLLMTKIEATDEQDASAPDAEEKE